MRRVISYNEELLLQGEKRGKIQCEKIGEKRGKKAGKKIGLIKSVILVLKTRFGEVPKKIAQEIKSYNNVVTLKSLVVLAVSCQSLEEFRNKLQ